jgi:hypothetical protein
MDKPMKIEDIEEIERRAARTCEELRRIRAMKAELHDLEQKTYLRNPREAATTILGLAKEVRRLYYAHADELSKKRKLSEKYGIVLEQFKELQDRIEREVRNAP